MNLNIIKDFFIKNNIKKSLRNSNLLETNSKINSVGLVLDATYFFELDALLEDLYRMGLHKNQISVLIFKNRIKKTETFNAPSFEYADINWLGNFQNEEVKKFVATPFDLLISYYDTEKMPLFQVTNLSSATFKVGFSSVDSRLNHFMINTNAENNGIFVIELQKYLKILNKL